MTDRDALREAVEALPLLDAPGMWISLDEVLAIIAAAEPAGLDVERLRQAHYTLFAIDGRGVFGGYIDQLAAEYARLTAEAEPPKRDCNAGWHIAKPSPRCPVCGAER